MEWLLGLLVLLSKNSLWSVLLLTLVSVTLTLEWIILGYIYLGIILTIVYAGAIIILIVFVLYILDLNKIDIIENKPNWLLVIVSVLIILLIKDKWILIDWSSNMNIGSDINELGVINSIDKGLILVVTSMLLLISIIGTIYLLIRISKL